VTALYAADEEMAVRENRLPIHLLLFVFGVSFLVFAVFAWRPVFWVDEYLTQSAISRPWAGLLNYIARADPAPGPYYLVMKIWSTISIDLFWMRLPSILAMACAVLILTRLVHRVAGPGTACLTAAVLLVMPNVSRFAQENRPYAFAVLGTVAAVALWHRSVNQPRSRASVGYAGAVAGMGLAHLYTLTLIPALMVAALAGPADQRTSSFWRTTLPRSSRFSSSHPTSI
jgi:mannosyltransferase